MEIKNFFKNKKIVIFVFLLLFVIISFCFYKIALARTFGQLEVHTSFARYCASGYTCENNWSHYGGVSVTVRGDGGSWYGEWDRKWFSCANQSIFYCPSGSSKCNFLSYDTKTTDNSGWAKWNYLPYGFQSCKCTFYVDLPLNASNAVYGGSWSRYLGFENPSCNDGVWPTNNNCYSLLSWSYPYWRFQTPMWGNENIYRPYFDWCENECPSEGTKEQKTENGIKYERTCGYYDKDTCYDWGPWEKISQPPTPTPTPTPTPPTCFSQCGCKKLDYSGVISAKIFNQLRKDINNSEKTIQEKIDRRFKITQWTDDPLKAGYKIKAIYINEMCTAVKKINRKLNTKINITCRDNIKAGEMIRSSYIENICNDLNNIIDKWNKDHGC